MSSSTPARLSCLRGGGCEAVPLGQPQDVLAQAEGYRLLGISNEAVPEYLYTVTAARRSCAAANSELVVRYVRALAASFGMIREPARRAAVVAAIVDITAVSPAIAEREHRRTHRHRRFRGTRDGRHAGAAVEGADRRP